MWFINTVDCYEAFNRNEALLHAMTYMNPKNLKLRKPDAKGSMPQDFIHRNVQKRELHRQKADS